MMMCSHRTPPLKSHNVKRPTLVYAFDSPKAIAKFIDAAARYAAVKRCRIQKRPPISNTTRNGRPFISEARLKQGNCKSVYSASLN